MVVGRERQFRRLAFRPEHPDDSPVAGGILPVRQPHFLRGKEDLDLGIRADEMVLPGVVGQAGVTTDPDGSGTFDVDHVANLTL